MALPLSIKAIPLFVTSTAIPLFVVVLRVILTPKGEEMTPHDATVYALLLCPVLGTMSRLLTCFSQIHLLRDVLAHHYAAPRRLHALQRT